MSPPAQVLPFHGFGSENALREMADHLPDGLFTIDLDGRVTYWNTAAERITGWTREEAIGQTCSLLAGDAVNGCACGVGPLRCGLAERGRTSKCCTMRTRDGTLKLIVKNAVPLFAPDGSPVGALESFTDVGMLAPFAPPPGAPGEQAGDFCGLVGRGTPMQDLYRMIGLVARSDATVMILGESGTGKELVAEAIHRTSPRAGAPFVRVSCSALNENLLESELFGHVKGAFTGALRDRRGRFEEAEGGTLLLDEIGDVSPLVQVKLLRVIEQREVERVGDSQPRKVDVRLLCATHRDLKQLVADGRFRADLFFRLHVFPLRVPPLRDRPEDLEALALRTLARVSPPGVERKLAPAALERLRRYAWPGNVRELQNVVEYAALQAGLGDVDARHLPLEVGGPAPSPSPSPVSGGVGGFHFETPARTLPPAGPEAGGRAELERLLEAHAWNRTAAARVLGVSRVTLWKRMKRLGVRPPRGRVA